MHQVCQAKIACPVFHFGPERDRHHCPKEERRVVGAAHQVGQVRQNGQTLVKVSVVPVEHGLESSASSSCGFVGPNLLFKHIPHHLAAELDITNRPARHPLANVLQE